MNSIRRVCTNMKSGPATSFCLFGSGSVPASDLLTSPLRTSHLAATLSQSALPRNDAAAERQFCSSRGVSCDTMAGAISFRWNIHHLCCIWYSFSLPYAASTCLIVIPRDATSFVCPMLSCAAAEKQLSRTKAMGVIRVHMRNIRTCYNCARVLP